MTLVINLNGTESLQDIKAHTDKLVKLAEINAKIESHKNTMYCAEISHPTYYTSGAKKSHEAYMADLLRQKEEISK